MMKVLVEITHPAHVHFFRNSIVEFQKKGHDIAVTAREKDITVELLEKYNIPFTILSKIGRGKFTLISELITRDVRLWNFCRKFKPDILTGIGGVFAAHVGFVLGKPVVVWGDTEIATKIQKITYPFTTAFYSPDTFPKSLGKKHYFYPGLHELAYLHPDRFTPDFQIVQNIGIDPADKYCIIRFVSWKAHHDVGQHGFDTEQKLQFIKEIAKYARPYISSESPLPGELEAYRLNIPPNLIHHVLAFAALYVGEGATMATESAILGVPVVYVNTLKLSNINMLEEYGLAKQAIDTKQALQKSLEWLNEPEIKEKCKTARKKLLEEKIDVTAFIVQTIERHAYAET